MQRFARPRHLAILIALVTASALFAPSATAGTAQIVVVAGGLDNPRGIALKANGTILVAESGAGGATCVGSGANQLCFGKTASITRISPDGSMGTPVKLPSLAGDDGFGSVGASDVAFEDGTMFIAMGGGPAAVEAVDLFGKKARPFYDLLSAKPLETLANLYKFESNHDPAGDGIDTNPYGVARVDGGTLVADAGGNDLILVTDDGARELVATFPTQELLDPGGNPIPAQAVPNSVTVGPDGAWYVGQLTGFPFTPGSSRVWRVDPAARGVACDAAATSGPCTLFADGLTAIIDIAFGPDGHLYVLEIAKNGVLALESGAPTLEDLTGALLRMDGTTFTEIASEGLITPAGLAIGADGRIFVTNYGVFPGDGQVVEVIVPA
jgi:sugar lactone lactonase YvrE